MVIIVFIVLSFVFVGVGSYLILLGFIVVVMVNGEEIFV